MRRRNSVLILGSALSALDCKEWSRDMLRARYTHVVAVNNAWQIRPDWDVSIFPEDFPPERRPQTLTPSQHCVEAREFVRANNLFGGVFYAGGTMAFTAGYWALHALRPFHIAYLGCDMLYDPAPDAMTHFYGRGHADPLRDDPSLRNLEAKSARLWLHAAKAGCDVRRLSTGPSRLTFPCDLVGAPTPQFDAARFDALKAREKALGYHVRSGRYWETASGFDLAEIDALDADWLAALEAKTAAKAPRPSSSPASSPA